MAGTLKVAVTGATGFVGRAVVRELLSRGHTVKALVRDRKKAAQVLPPSNAALTLVQGDIEDDRAVQELLTGVDACVNLIGIIREVRSAGKSQTFQRMHVGATRRLVSACEKGGVQRYVQMSALGVCDTGKAEYQRTKFEAEMIVRRSALEWTILRPGLIHGVDGEFMQMVKGWCTGLESPYVFLPYFRRTVEDTRVPLGPINEEDPRIAPVAVEDVAWAFAQVLETPASVGEVYNLTGPESMTWPEFLRFVRDRVHGGNSALQPFGIPANVAALAADGAALAGMSGLLPFDSGMAHMGAQDVLSSPEKAQKHLSFKPRPFRASFESYAHSL